MKTISAGHKLTLEVFVTNEWTVPISHGPFSVRRARSSRRSKHRAAVQLPPAVSTALGLSQQGASR